MIRLTWWTLVVSFLFYTGYVYVRCSDNHEVIANETVDQGQTIWREKNCQSCHQLYGLGGYLGPDLTNSYSEKGPDYMKGIIQHGTSRMPDYQLSKVETDKLIAFLQWVDKSGKSKVDAENVHWTGTYIIPPDGKN